MEYKHTIIFVPDIIKIIEFYEKVFKLQRKFIHPSNTFAELSTGNVTIAFATIDLSPLKKVSREYFNICLSFVSDDVDRDYQLAIENGARSIEKPNVKPWRQKSSYVEDVNGVVVEICSRINT